MRQAVQAHPLVAIVGTLFIVIMLAVYTYVASPLPSSLPSIANNTSQTSSSVTETTLNLQDTTSNHDSGQFWAKKKGRCFIGLAVILGISLALLKQMYTIYTTHRTPSLDSQKSSKG